MQNVERMFVQLVKTIRARHPNLLTQPFGIGDLADTILPYRHNRRELGFETNDEYEITIVQLLASDYVIVDADVRDAMRAELRAPNPDPAGFRRFADSVMAVSPQALRALDASNAPQPEAPPAPPPSAPTTGSPARPLQTPSHPSAMATRPSGGSPTRTPSSSVRTDAPRVAVRGIVPEKGDTCRYCDGALPPGRAIIFCPHCGQNLTMASCPACGSELEVGWRFCPTCGRQSASQ